QYKKGKLQVFRAYSLKGHREALKLSGSQFIMPDERTFFFALNRRSSVFSELPNRQKFKDALNTEAINSVLTTYGLSYSSTLASPSFHFGAPKNIRLQKGTKWESKAKLRVLSMASQEVDEVIKAALINVNYESISLPK